MDSRKLLLDKALGMVAALAIGDTLGAAHEYDKNEYSSRVRPYHVRLRWVTRSNATQPTDDTEMSLALLRTVVSSGGFKKEDVIYAYLSWANGMSLARIKDEEKTPMTGMGKNTANLLKGVKTMSGYESRVKERMSENCQSNGSLMRISPLALFNAGPKWAIEDTKITNISMVNQQISYVYVYTLRLLLLNQNPSEFLRQDYGYLPEVKKCIQEGMNPVNKDHSSFLKHFNITFKGKANGWVLVPFYLTIYYIYHHTDLSSVYKEIIELGGDTDTNCAIVGAAIGAIYGFEKLSENPDFVYNWNMVRNYHTQVSQGTQKTDQPRHLDFTLEGIEDLLEQALILNDRLS